MSLDEDLRAVLDREAAQRTAPPPDVEGLIHGGRVRRRRRNATRLGVGVVATVLAGATALGVADLEPRAESDVASTPSRTPRTYPPTLSIDDRQVLEPGTYRMFVGHSAGGALVSAHVSVDGPNWTAADFPLVSDENGRAHAGVGVYQPQALAAGNGCEAGPTLVALARTSEGLAAQLADLPRSTVLREPSLTEVLGVQAVHLRLRIDVDCPGFYRVAHAAGGTRGITYAPLAATAPNVIIDFWVLDVDGAMIVVDQWRDVDAPPGVVTQAHDARESIVLVRGS